MSYERAESFTEDTDATASTIESEFDNIADAFNGLFQAARVSATEDLALGALADVPGASRTITPTVPSLLIVIAGFQASTDDGAFGHLNVDGSDQPQQVETVGKQGSQSYCVALGVGAHTVKLRASGSGTLRAIHTGYTYLLIPEP